MNTPDFNKTRNYLHDISTKELERKGPDYSPDSDRLGNFKEVAAFLGVSPKIVWGVYMLKHLFAIRKWVQGGTLTSEGLEGRFVDLRNYIDLGYGLSAEDLVSYETIASQRKEYGPGKCSFEEAMQALGEPVAKALWEAEGYKVLSVEPCQARFGETPDEDFEKACRELAHNQGKIPGLYKHTMEIENANPRDRSRPTPNRVRSNRRGKKRTKSRSQ